jgi:hypothetical protein
MIQAQTAKSAHSNDIMEGDEGAVPAYLRTKITEKDESRESQNVSAPRIPFPVQILPAVPAA